MKVVARVQAFKENRTDMVILALDQVPFRAKIRGGRQAYSPEEFATKAERKRLKEEGTGPEEPHGGMTQSRGQESANAEKYRITVELRQVILNYFKDGVDPVGIPGPTAIVVGGTHCRLSNIDEQGCWRKTEEF